MNPQDILITIAEISIGLAGFSGLVAAFTQKQNRGWRSDQKTRIVFLIALSFGMIVTSLLPFAISDWSSEPRHVWGIPMVLYSTIVLGLLAYWITVSRKNGYQIQFPLASYPILVVGTVLQILVLISGLGLFMPYSPGLFVYVFLALLNTIWE
jgi:hypothetical protein